MVEYRTIFYNTFSTTTDTEMTEHIPADRTHASLPSLANVRQQIDDIDTEILVQLHKRITLARMVGCIKGDGCGSKKDPVREREIYERLIKENKNLFPEKSLLSIFHEIITTCLLIQQKNSIAYLGPEATFTHLAGVRYFGQSADYKPMESIEDVFTEVERKRVTYGVVPVENSIEGAVFSTLDAFMRHQVKICGEVQLEIIHNLVNQSGNMEDVKKIVSHAQPIAQCRNWLKKNLPAVETMPVFSTGAAAQMAAADPGIAAIAGDLAIKTYRLQIIKEGIQDFPGNTTRFLILGRETPGRSGRDKTSLLVGLMDRPGALHEVLTILSDHDINLTKIESRPIREKQWKYLFFIDTMGHITDRSLADACARLRTVCSFFEVLGSYPQADELTGHA